MEAGMHTSIQAERSLLKTCRQLRELSGLGSTFPKTRASADLRQCLGSNLLQHTSTEQTRISHDGSSKTTRLPKNLQTQQLLNSHLTVWTQREHNQRCAWAQNSFGTILQTCRLWIFTEQDELMCTKNQGNRNLPEYEESAAAWLLIYSYGWSPDSWFLFR